MSEGISLFFLFLTAGVEQALEERETERETERKSLPGGRKAAAAAATATAASHLAHSPLYLNFYLLSVMRIRQRALSVLLH